ncbi:MAG TPA: transcriptional regulator [Tepidisphaeraceae bacterium]|jgi:DNA-binding MarR family transcriptional regulator
MSERKTHDRKVSGRYAYHGLERLLHERSRLGILSSLAAHPEGLAFNDLKTLVSLTDGNLSRQIQILQDEGLLEVEKSTANNRPHTLCKLSSDGRQRFVEYIEELERVIADARSKAAAGPLPQTS